MKRLVLTAVTALTLVVTLGGAASAVENGQFCSPQGATATDSKGRALVCDNQDANGRFHWTLAQSATTTTQATTVTTALTTTTTAAVSGVGSETTTTQAAVMARTGARENREAAIGFAAVLVGVLLVWRARPRLLGLLATPQFIPYERIEARAKLLGWSDGWAEHLAGKKPTEGDSASGPKA